MAVESKPLFHPEVVRQQVRAFNLAESCAGCYENLVHMIGLGMKAWALGHHGQFPFSVSTNEGGTREHCDKTADGFDNNSFLHLLVMSNELGSTTFLVCPRDRSKKAAANFQTLSASNVTYRLRSGSSVNDTNPAEVLAACPIDGNTLHCDGGFTPGPGDMSLPTPLFGICGGIARTSAWE